MDEEMDYETRNADIVVIKASYGPRDITKRIREMVGNGRRKFTANNTDYCGDPQHGVVKSLIINYTFNGQKCEKKVFENAGEITLTKPP